MKKIGSLLVVVVLVGLLNACKDQTARDAAQTVSDDVRLLAQRTQTYADTLHVWHMAIHNSLCQLEAELWPDGQAPNEDALYCPPGAPDSPAPPEPEIDPWG